MFFRRKLMLFARFVDRHTRWLDGYKYRLGLFRLAVSALGGGVSEKRREKILSSLRGDIVEKKLQALAQAGCDKPEVYVLCVESIGDVIACEPIARNVRGMSPRARITWIVRKGLEELVAFNPTIDAVLPVASLGEGEDICSEKRLMPNAVIVNCHMDGWRCMRTNRVFANPNNPEMNMDTYFFLTGILGAYSTAAGLPMLDDSPVFHLDPSLKTMEPAGGSPYVVFHCHSTDTTKNWTVDNWNRLAGAVIAAGWHVVEVGTLKIVQSSSPYYHDWSGNRRFQEIGQIIRVASLYVGIDSCFAHMANCFRIPSVILLGRYRNYDAYNPYSGPFSRDGMRLVRAPTGKPAETIPFDQALDAVRQACIASSGKSANSSSRFGAGSSDGGR